MNVVRRVEQVMGFPLSLAVRGRHADDHRGRDARGADASSSGVVVVRSLAELAGWLGLALRPSAAGADLGAGAADR